MANVFGFQMSEDFLSGYAAYLKSLREQNPEKSYVVSLSVDLIPDGIGYEIRDRPQITIEEVGAESKKEEHPVLDVAGMFEIDMSGWAENHDELLGEAYLGRPIEPE